MPRLPALLIALAVWSTVAAAAPSSPGAVRDRPTAQALLDNSNPPDRPIHNDYFMPVGDAGPALHGFSGTLSIPMTMMRTPGV